MCKYYGLDEVSNYWYNVIKINDYQKAILSCHYLFSTDKFLNLKLELLSILKINESDLNDILRNEIKSKLIYYLKNLNNMN